VIFNASGLDDRLIGRGYGIICRCSPRADFVDD